MVSVTSWVRVEPLPRTPDLAPALEARIADPLWLLARQWQTGEYQAEDAGSPILATLRADVGHLSRYHPGPLPPPGAGGVEGPDPAARSLDYDDLGAPLEVVVEHEPARRPGMDGRVAGRGGLHLRRLLAANGVAEHATAFADAFPLEDGPPGWRGAVADGAVLRAALRAGDVTVDVPAPARAAVGAALDAWTDWWDAHVSEPDGPTAWDPTRLEYRFAVSAELDQGPVTLTVDEYTDGELDWWAFRAAGGPSLGPADPPVPATAVVREVIPTPVAYPGMPVDRFWEFEDGRVNLAAVTAGSNDLARLLLTEFALVYSNDWFVIPLDLDVGSVCDVRSLEVVDTFGQATVVPPSRDVGGTWTMFTLDAPAEPGHLRDLFLLPPVLGRPQRGDPIEEVAFVRDEGANLAWAVERRVLRPDGVVLDREVAERGRALAAAADDDGRPDGVPRWRLQHPVPEHWIPLVPVAPDDGGADLPAVELERRALLRVRDDGATEPVAPLGRVLVPGEPLRLDESEIPGAGLVVDRAYESVRWLGGATHVWVGRRAVLGAPPQTSGLRFDVVDPADPA